MSSANYLNSNSCIQGSASAPLSLPHPSDGGAGTASSDLSQARHVLIHFLEDYLDIAGLFVGFQSRFGHGSDLILFRAPQTGSTLAVECDVMLLQRGQALEVIREKVAANRKTFEGKS